MNRMRNTSFISVSSVLAVGFKWCEQNRNPYRRILILRLYDQLATGASVAQLSQHSNQLIDIKPFSRYNRHYLHCKHKGGQGSDLLVCYLRWEQTMVEDGWLV